jgi:hypothetical protein
MTTATPVVLFDTQFASDTDTEMFVSPEEGAGTTVDKFTATNTDSVTRTITVRLVPPDETPTGTDFLIVDAQTLTTGQRYLFPEVVGQMLAAGGSIRVQASAANVVIIRANGRNWT